jgi:hypothetical protein
VLVFPCTSYTSPVCLAMHCDGNTHLKGFAYLQHGPTEIWEDNASCILMSENPTNRERSRHVDVRVHFLPDMVRDGSVKLIKCAGTQNVADALTKSLPRPAFHKHREFLKGTAQSFSAFFASAYEPGVPAYVTKRGSLSFLPHRLPRSAWIASLRARITSLGARESPPLERVDHLPGSTSSPARGSPPSEDVPCVALMGSLEHRPAARSCGCTRLLAHASQTSTKRAGDSAQAQRTRAQHSSCGTCMHLCSRLFGCDCLLKEHRHWPLQNQARGSRLGSL